MTTPNLAAILLEISQKNWSEKARPVLLSALPKLLNEQLNDDYKSLLAEESLKSFIKRTEEQSGYRLVEHPTQRAKLGLIPASENFSFESEEKSSTVIDMNRDDIYAFARVLQSLSEDDRKSITFPASVVMKLLLAK
mgnify:CR=1 FL=1